MKIDPIENAKGELVGIQLMVEEPQDLRELLRGCTYGMSSWGDRPKWAEEFLDLLRRECGL